MKEYTLGVIRISIMCIISVCFVNCVSSKIVSFRDPTVDVSFGRILVIANYDNFEAVQKIETLMVKEFKNRGVYAIANSSLLPPIRQYSNEEKLNVLIKEELDGYIIISPSGVNNATIYVPTISKTDAKAKVYDNRVYGSSQTQTYEGGARNVVSSIDTKAELYDLDNGQIVWKGETNTSIKYNAYGQSFASVDKVLSSFCVKIVDDLLKNSLLYR